MTTTPSTYRSPRIRGREETQARVSNAPVAEPVDRPRRKRGRPPGRGRRA